MNLEAGSEQDFFEYVGNLGEKDKIALITHTDLDGLTAGVMVDRVVDADIVKLLGYTDLHDGLVDELREAGVNKVITTDLFIKDPGFVKKLESFAEVLILDHHPFREDWNSDKTVFIKVEDGYCAGYLCYKLFSRIKSLEKLDWLVACSCVSDYCFFKTEDWLTEVFEKYGDVFEISGDYVRKSGKFWDLQYKLSLAMIYFRDDLKKVFDSIGEDFGNIGDLGKHADEVESEIRKFVKIFDEKGEEFERGYLYEFDPKFAVGSIVSNILSNKERDKFFVIVRPDKHDESYHVSVRRQDKKESSDKFLVDLLGGLEGADGGGHDAAAGGHFLKKDLGEIKRRLGVKGRVE